MTATQPENGAPHCSALLVPLKWRVETAERPVPIPFTLEPTVEKRFRLLLPAAKAAAAQAHFFIKTFSRVSRSMRFPEEIGLKLVVDPPAGKSSRKAQPRPTTSFIEPPLRDFIRTELTGADTLANRPRIENESGFSATARLAPALETSVTELALDGEACACSIPLPEAVAVAVDGYTGVELLPCAAVSATPGLLAAAGLAFEMDAAPAVAIPAAGFATIAPSELAPSQAAGLAVEFPPEATSAPVCLPLPLEASLAALELRSDDGARALPLPEPIAVAAGQADVELLPCAGVTTAPRLLAATGIAFEVESAPISGVAAAGFATVALSEFAPSQAAGLAVEFPPEATSAPVCLPLPLEASLAALELRSDDDARAVPLPEFIAASACRADVELLPCVATAPRLLAATGLAFEIESAPIFGVAAADFATIAPSEPAPSPAAGLAVEFPPASVSAPVCLPLPLEASVAASELRSDDGARAVPFPEAIAVAPRQMRVEPLPCAAVAATPNLFEAAGFAFGIQSAPAVAIRAAGFATIALSQVAPSGSRGLAVEFPPALVHAAARLPLPLQIFAPALAGEESARRISHPSIQAVAAPGRPYVEPLPFTTAAPALHADLGLEIAAESMPAATAQADGFAAIAPTIVAPSMAHGLVTSLSALHEAIGPRLPRPLETSVSVPALAGDDGARCISYPEAQTAPPLRQTQIDPLPFAAVAAPASLPAAFELGIATESTPAMAAPAENFAPIASTAVAPAQSRSLAVELAAIPTPPSASLPLPLEASAFAPAPAGEDCARPVSYPEPQTAAAPQPLPAEPVAFAAMAAPAAPSTELGLEIATDSTPTVAERAEDFAAVAPSQAAPAQAPLLAVPTPEIPVASPCLPEPMIESAAPAMQPAAAMPLPEASLPGDRPKVLAEPPLFRAPEPTTGTATALPLEADDDVPAAPDFENPPAVADLVPLEYFCQRSRVAASVPLEWSTRSGCILPASPFDKPAGKVGDLLPAKDAAKPFFAPKPKVEQRRWGGRYLELIAAVLVLATVLSTGLRIATRVGAQTPNVRRDVAMVHVSGTPAWQKPSSGPVEHIRNAISSRAAVEISDSFQAGMEAWGHVKNLAPGWSRSPDGYVQPGRLALFQPSMKFIDYRMEFFGEIESKSIDWVVRARDVNNYYAMKFTVIQKGLRPFIAVVHYPVVDGKAGRRSTIPLNVMVHNNHAYHVDVAVKGSRIVTSIEGQEVDRWIDDSVTSGGVGFFSEADERARVYWMKVAKNEDFLGRVCAYLTAGSSARRDVAMLVPQSLTQSQGINQGMNYGIQFFTAAGYGN